MRDAEIQRERDIRRIYLDRLEAHQEMVASIDKVRQLFEEPAIRDNLDAYARETDALATRILDDEGGVSAKDYIAARSEVTRRRKFMRDFKELGDVSRANASAEALKNYENANGALIWDLIGKPLEEVKARITYPTTLINQIVLTALERMVGKDTLEDMQTHGLTPEELAQAIRVTFKPCEYRHALEGGSSILVEIRQGAPVKTETGEQAGPPEMVIGEDPRLPISFDELYSRAIEALGLSSSKKK